MTCNASCSRISPQQRCTLNAYTTTQAGWTENQTLSFDDYENSGTSIGLSNNGNKIILKEGGLYYITFNAYGVITTPGTTPTKPEESFYIKMQANGVDVPGAEAAINAQSFGSLNFSKIVKVNPICNFVDNSVDITFTNSGVPITTENINVVIIKLA